MSMVGLALEEQMFNLRHSFYRAEHEGREEVWAVNHFKIILTSTASVP
jgi:hypothetical protein